MESSWTIAALTWVLPVFHYGFLRLMAKHADREFMAKSRNPFTMIEGQASLFAGEVLWAMTHTFWAALPDPSTWPISFFMVIVIDLVVIGSFWLFWRSFPDMPSYFAWRRPDEPLPDPRQSTASESPAH